MSSASFTASWKEPPSDLSFVNCSTKYSVPAPVLSVSITVIYSGFSHKSFANIAEL